MLDVPYDLMLKRLKDGENFNDQMETVQRRVNTYRETTEPVIAAYSANITKVGVGAEMEKAADAVDAVRANFFTGVLFFSPRVFKGVCRIYAIFGFFCSLLNSFEPFFAHILCANFPGSKLCPCYFIRFFHLCV